MISKQVGQDEKDFEDILSKIAELAAKTNFEEIDGIRGDKQDSEYYLNEAEKAAESLKNFVSQLDEAKVEYNDVKNKSDVSTNSFVKLQDKINHVEMSVVDAQAKGAAIKESIQQVDDSIMELKRSVELDTVERYSNKLAKQESLKSKVKESGVTLSRTKTVC